MRDSAVLLYVSVIKSECVTKLLINPAIRNRTRLISSVYHPTRHNILCKREADQHSFSLLHYSSFRVSWVPCHQGMACPKVADVSWVSCHRGMARHQVVDGGDGLQIWKVVANILNKQTHTADKGLSSSRGVVRGGNNSSPQKKKLACYKSTTKSHRPGWILCIHEGTGHVSSTG
jgi:hypothetical protein